MPNTFFSEWKVQIYPIVSEDSILYQPCPLSAVTKMMAESVAKNFQMLWAYVQDDARYCCLPISYSIPNVSFACWVKISADNIL